jgi:hypothetical protein
MQPGQQTPNYIPPEDPSLPARDSRTKDIVVIILAIFGLIYIFIPSIIPDFVPDFIPFVGQIDDDLAVMLVLNSLRYFGYDIAAAIPGLRWVLSRRKADDKPKR